jgi:shikimate dehydrogenase
MGRDISGRAGLAGVAGWPIAHSSSPRLHTYWLERYAIDGVYVPLAIPPDRFVAAVKLLPALGFRGINVTIPHKEAAFAAMDGCDDGAARLGAVNTVVIDGHGRLNGSNTDGYGFVEHLRASVSGWRADRPAAVVGAGGAALAVVDALLRLGVPEIRVANRTGERARALADRLGKAVAPVSWDDRGRMLAGVGLLVNTTALGMRGQPPLTLDLSALPLEAPVYDLVYVPLETELLRAARRRHHPTVDGLGMLLHQARPGFAAWFGVEPAVDRSVREHVLAGLTS